MFLHRGGSWVPVGSETREVYTNRSLQPGRLQVISAFTGRPPSGTPKQDPPDGVTSFATHFPSPRGVRRRGSRGGDSVTPEPILEEEPRSQRDGRFTQE